MKRLRLLCTVLAVLTIGMGHVYVGGSPKARAETLGISSVSDSLSLAPSPSGVPGTETHEAAVSEVFGQITHNDNIHAAILLKDGDIILAHYQAGYDEDSVFAFNSCAKSVLSVLMGIAMDQGLIESLDTKIGVYFPEIENDPDSRKKDITIGHLLGFTSGLDWPEWGAWHYWPGEFVSSPNWVRFVLSRPMIAEPGTEFAYNTGASQLLSAILQKVSGEDALTFAEKNLFKPLDITGVQWGNDPQGITTGGFQISMKPRDAAKIGQLYLNKGYFNGQQIVSEAWVTESTQVHSQGGYFGSRYGYHWWVEDGEDVDYYYAMGYGGQYIFIAPACNRVAVFASDLPMQQMDLPKTYFESLISSN